jgi:hypothetical protein
MCRPLAENDLAEDAVGIVQWRLKHQGGEDRLSLGLASGQ